VIELDQAPVLIVQPAKKLEVVQKFTVTSQKTDPKVESKVVETIKVATIKAWNKDKKVWPIMVTYWFSTDEAKYIGEWCYHNTQDPLHCKAMITHACKQETNCWLAWVWTRNNLFWVYDSSRQIFPSYDTRLDSIKQRLIKYKRFWHKNSCTQMLSRSRYCVSECNDRVPNCYFIFEKFNA